MDIHILTSFELSLVQINLTTCRRPLAGTYALSYAFISLQAASNWLDEWWSFMGTFSRQYIILYICMDVDAYLAPDCKLLVQKFSSRTSTWVHVPGHQSSPVHHFTVHDGLSHARYVKGRHATMRKSQGVNSYKNKINTHASYICHQTILYFHTA